MCSFLSLSIANLGHLIKIANTKIPIAEIDKRVVNRRLDKFRNREIGNTISTAIAIIITFKAHVSKLYPKAFISVRIKSSSNKIRVIEHIYSSNLLMHTEVTETPNM